MDQETNKVTSNYNYTNYTALQIRLDTKPILDDIEMFIRGYKLVIDQNSKGKITTRKLKVGTPKANDLGVQSIVSYITAILNPQVVQGNFDDDQWESYVQEIHLNLTTNIVTNCYNWKIDDEDVDVIIDFIMALIIPFTSRLLNNEERKSYSDTIKSFENNSLQKASTGLFKS